MTVTTTASSISYAGNGTTKAFAFPYVFFAPTDLVVTLIVTATNVPVSPAPVLNGAATYDYTVSGTVTDAEYASGGTVTFNTAPATGLTVLLVRAVPATQTVTLIDNTKFPAATVNAEFDKLTVLVQQGTGAPGPTGPPGPTPGADSTASTAGGDVHLATSSQWYDTGASIGPVGAAGQKWLFTGFEIATLTVTGERAVSSRLFDGTIQQGSGGIAMLYNASNWATVPSHALITLAGPITIRLQATSTIGANVFSKAGSYLTAVRLS